jgi:hypothetical protein
MPRPRRLSKQTHIPSKLPAFINICVKLDGSFYRPLVKNNSPDLSQAGQIVELEYNEVQQFFFVSNQWEGGEMERVSGKEFVYNF